MKNIFLLLLILISCFSYAQLPKVLESNKTVLKLMKENPKFSISKFKKTDVNGIDLNRMLSEFPYTWKEYYPIDKLLEKKLFYSPNKKLFVDIYSASCYVDDEQTIACDAGPTPILLGNKSAKKLSSIDLISSSEQILDVIWLNDQEFYLIKEGILETEEFEIKYINLKTKTATIYKLLQLYL